ncbi:MAG: hypothetical protein H8D45_18865 [Bacteroidetes bacterium]|nr:hypothetical protein [Bacteroidota bacterium]
MNHIPALKNGASDLSYVSYNPDSCPDIYAEVKNSKINGIYANSTFSERIHVLKKPSKTRNDLREIVSDYEGWGISRIPIVESFYIDLTKQIEGYVVGIAF